MATIYDESIRQLTETGQIPTVDAGFSPDVQLRKVESLDIINNALIDTKEVNPDNHAKILDLSEKLDLSPDYVERNFDELTRKELENSTNVDTIVDKHPGLAKFMTSKNNAAIAKDDINNLASIDRNLDFIIKSKPKIGDQSLVEGMWHSGKIGLLELSSSSISLARAFDLISAEDAAFMNAAVNTDISNLNERSPDWLKEFNKVLQEEGNDVDKAWDRFLLGYYKITDVGVKEGFKDFALGGITSVAQLADLVSRFPRNPKGALAVMTQNLTSFLPSIITGAAAAKIGALAGGVGGTAVAPGPGTAVGATTIGTLSFIGGAFIGQVPVEMGFSLNDDLLKRGVRLSDPTDLLNAYSNPELMSDLRSRSIRNGLTHGVVNALFNAYAGKYLARARGQGLIQTGKAFVKEGIVQGAGEGIEEFSAMAAREKSLKGVELSEVGLEIGGGMFHQFGESIIGAGTRNQYSKNPIKAGKQFVKKAQSAIESLSDHDSLRMIGNFVKESKLMNRKPNKIKELIRNVMPDDEISNIYFDVESWDDFWVSRGLSPLRASEDILGDSGTNYALAKRDGLQIEIPLDDFVSKVANTNEYEEILNIARTRPDGMTIGEARGFMQSVPATSEEIANEIVEQDKDSQDPLNTIIPSDQEEQFKDKLVNDEIEELDKDYPDSKVENSAFTVGPFAFKGKKLQQYTEMVNESRNVVRDKTKKRLLSEQMKERKPIVEKERQRIRKEIEDSINLRRDYNTLELLQNGKLADGSDPDSGFIPFKLDKKDIINRYGKDILKDLPKNPIIYTTKEGMLLDHAAEQLGYSSGDQLMQALIGIIPKKILIDTMTEAEVSSIFGDQFINEEISDTAIDEFHDENRTRILNQQLKHIASKRLGGLKNVIRAVTRPIPSSREMKFEAENIVENIPIINSNPNKYLVAEKKAGKQSGILLARGDLQGAANAKISEIRNHLIYKELIKSKNRLNSQINFIKGLNKENSKKILGNAGQSYVDRVDAILEQYEFKNKSIRSIRRRGNLRDFINKQEEEGIYHAVPDSVIEDSRNVNYKELTFGEIQDIYDALKSIMHMARFKDKLLVNKERRDKQQVLGELSESLVTNAKNLVQNTSEMQAIIASHGGDAKATFLTPTTIVRELSGFKDVGPWQDLKAIIDDAIVNKFLPRMLETETKEAEITLKHYTPKEIRQFQKKKNYTQIDAALSKEEILSIAQNRGNPSNWAAVQDSVNLLGRKRGKPTESELNFILDLLDKKDWDFLQERWDLAESFRGEIQESNIRRFGKKLKMVEAVPFKTKFGEYRGGYITLSYDREKTPTARDLRDKNYSDMVSGRKGKARTRANFRQERVGSANQAVKLSLNVLSRHLQDVVRDLSIGDEVNYISRILQDKSLQQDFRNVGALWAHDALDLWLKDVAAGEIVSGNKIDSTLRHLRAGVVASSLGWNVSTTMVQLTGLVNTYKTLGHKYVNRGIKIFMASEWRGPNSIWKQVQTMSKRMEYRAQVAFNKDIRDAKKIFSKMTFIPEPVRSSYFLFINKAQQVVDTINWLAAFERGKELHNDNLKKAIDFADNAVVRAQASALFSDRSAIERGTIHGKLQQSEWVKLFTTFSSYMVAKANIAYEKTRTTDFRSPSQIAKWSVDLIMLYLVEAAIIAAIRGNWPDEDDDESTFAFLTKEFLFSIGSTLPLMREVTSEIEGYRGGGVISTVSKRLADPVKQISQGEIDAALVKSLNNAGGLLFVYPSVQTNRVIDALWRNHEGEDVGIMEPLVGRPRK